MDVCLCLCVALLPVSVPFACVPVCLPPAAYRSDPDLQRLISEHKKAWYKAHPERAGSGVYEARLNSQLGIPLDFDSLNTSMVYAPSDVAERYEIVALLQYHTATKCIVAKMMWLMFCSVLIRASRTAFFTVTLLCCPMLQSYCQFTMLAC